MLAFSKPSRFYDHGIGIYQNIMQNGVKLHGVATVVSTFTGGVFVTFWLYFLD